MLHRTLMGACAALCCFAFAATAQAAPAVGQAAPDFSLKDLGGKTVKLSDYKGHWK